MVRYIQLWLSGIHDEDDPVSIKYGLSLGWTASSNVVSSDKRWRAAMALNEIHRQGIRDIAVDRWQSRTKVDGIRGKDSQL